MVEPRLEEPWPGRTEREEPRSLLLVTPRWRRDGGIATHAQSSALALARRGMEVHVLAREADEHEAVPGISVHVSASLTDAAVSLRERLGAAAGLDFDVAHLHQLDDPDVVAALRERAPVAISAHGYTACTSDVYYFRPGHECSRAHGPGCVPNLALRGCAHTRNPLDLPGAYARTTRGVLALREADLAISYSSAVDRHLANNSIEHRCVVPLFTTLAPAAPAAELPQRRRVLFAGRIVPSKGLTVLLKAMRLLDGELVVCGEGWQLQSLRRLAQRHGLQERVRFLGWLAPEDLARELADASLLALPSLWPEPFGLVGIEAHAAGLPVVASDTGGVRDWLEDGVNGLLCRPGDARDLAAKIDRLLSEEPLRRRLGEAGRAAVAERFTAERHVEAIVDAYARARANWSSRATAQAF